MSDDIKVGDEVEWSSSGGKSVGRVKKKLTEPIEIKGHHVAASADNPEFLVESDKSGGEAAHKPGSLKKSTARKSTAKKSSVKKSAAKKSSAKKPAAKKSSAKKSSAKKSSAR